MEKTERSIGAQVSSQEYERLQMAIFKRSMEQKAKLSASDAIREALTAWINSVESK